ncbi:MAG: phosphate--AMP phosphotransferase [Planctomycetota bacterium]|nr:MAG: phosphate--AMP phosphotransferase [Planctomycetota bacterium]
MLELVDLNQRLDRETYGNIFPQIEARLGEAQRAARRAGVPVILVFEGWEAAGKGVVINRLTQALDPRGFKVHAISAPDETESRYPWLWRFWNALPADGVFGIFDRSWYGRVLVERMERGLDSTDLNRAFEEIHEFERQLTDSGAVLLKFWMHIDKKEQRRRFRRLEKHPATAWKIGKREWNQNRHYDKWLDAVEDMLARTSTAEAPWTVVEATQKRFARVKVFETIATAIERELQRRENAPKVEPVPMQVPTEATMANPRILDRVDLSVSLDRAQYEEELDRLQKRLFRLEHELYLAQIPVAIVYEGWDAAGKGGNIKRLTRGLDPRGYEVVPIAAPNTEEKAHHYLWRFWKHVPKAGHITIFDRSWYGRVLVERVEGFCTESEWRRAYREINEFERQLAEFGTVIVKFWLHIDQEEQLRRFKARQEDPAKQWKITDEDWRNREKWPQYAVAVDDMLRRTSTSYAPWTILEANCKLYARIKALRTVADAIENAVRRAKK